MKVRMGKRTLLKSTAMRTCVIFVIICAPLLLFFLSSMEDSDGTLFILYGIAAAAPGFGIIAAVLSVAVVWWRRRQAVLIVDEQVHIPSTGIEFPLSDLHTVQLWSDRTARSWVALLPSHVMQRADTDGVRAVAPYVVGFPRGSTPRPFECVELLLQRHPELIVERLGILPEGR